MMKFDEPDIIDSLRHLPNSLECLSLTLPAFCNKAEILTNFTRFIPRNLKVLKLPNNFLYETSVRYELVSFKKLPSSLCALDISSNGLSFIHENKLNKILTALSLNIIALRISDNYLNYKSLERVFERLKFFRV